MDLRQRALSRATWTLMLRVVVMSVRDTVPGLPQDALLGWRRIQRNLLMYAQFVRSTLLKIVWVK